MNFVSFESFVVKKENAVPRNKKDSQNGRFDFTKCPPLSRGVMVAQRSLTPLVQVQVLAGQPLFPSAYQVLC